MPEIEPNVKRPAIRWLLAGLTAACLVGAPDSFAIPKAAEHENAPVTAGADVARPKLAAKPAKPHVQGKKRDEAKKVPHETKAAKKTAPRK